jgi:hypothetical protein
MLTKNPEPAPYEGATSNLYRDSWRKRCRKESKLIGMTIRDEVSPELIRLANVPAGAADSFRYEIGHRLVHWHLKLAFHTQGDTEASRIEVVNALRRNAKALLANFKKLDKHPLLAMNLATVLPDRSSHSFRQLLSCLSDLLVAVDHAQLAEYRRGPGARGGIRGYPNLETLIFDLQLAAVRTVASGFTVDKATGCSLLQALNVLRAALLRHKQLQWLAAFIPSSNRRHPVTTYRRILREGPSTAEWAQPSPRRSRRQAHRKGRQLRLKRAAPRQK